MINSFVCYVGNFNYKLLVHYYFQDAHPVIYYVWQQSEHSNIGMKCDKECEHSARMIIIKESIFGMFLLTMSLCVPFHIMSPDKISNIAEVYFIKCKVFKYAFKRGYRWRNLGNTV